MSSETSAKAACCNANWPTGVDILYPSNEGFNSATQRWNAYGGPSYCAAVSPSSEEEVASIVKAANAAKVPFLATSGRHNFGTSLKALKNAIAIDIKHLNAVTVDAESSTVTVGGGASNQQVLDTVVAAGFMIPSGTCGCAGYLGAGIGAGIGYSQGTLGLAIDSLVSAKVVTASGDLINVSKDSNPDLFWGVRGAGANFGIITSAVFKLQKQVNDGMIYYADLIYTPDQSAAYFAFVETLNDGFPSKLGFSTTMFWDADNNQTNVLATLVWAGPEEEAREALSGFFDLNPIPAVSKSIARNELPKLALLGIIQASCSTVNGVVSIPSVNVRHYSAKTWASVYSKFDAYLKKYPDTRESAFIFETFSTAAPLSVADDETAYPWRDATGNIMLQLRWGGLDDAFQKTANAFGKEIRADLAATSGYPDMSVYVSYSYGDETLEQKFGKDKLPKLLKLKKEYDPESRFGYCSPLVSST